MGEFIEVYWIKEGSYMGEEKVIEVPASECPHYTIGTEIKSDSGTLSVTSIVTDGVTKRITLERGSFNDLHHRRNRAKP